MGLSCYEIQQVAERMLADYDAHQPNEIFAERGTDWLTLHDAYAVQRAVAELRKARGERCLGYKVGCLSATIQKQFGLHQPVYGHVWESEALVSGSHLSYLSHGLRVSRFVNLAIEGEIAMLLARDITPGIPDDDLPARVDRWFPVIELHNYVFRGATRTSQELVAGNALHAGFVAPPSGEGPGFSRLSQAQVRVEINGELTEAKSISQLPGGPFGSVRWLASALASSKQSLKAGDIVLTGSPGRLIPVGGRCSVVVICERQRVELIID